jgi:hypothetical protein
MTMTRAPVLLLSLLFVAGAAGRAGAQAPPRDLGLTSVPELLRMVPGVQVGQLDAHTWPVSVRGFNGRYSNKLLVLIDMTVGFRADSTAGPHAFTVEGSGTVGDAGSRVALLVGPAPLPAGPVLVDATTRNRDFDLLARWTRTGARGSTLRLQSFVDVIRRDDPSDPASRDRAAAFMDANAPGQQWMLRSTLLVGTRIEIDARWLPALLAIGIWGPAPGTSGQEAVEAALKAAYLYSFARFTEWPADTLGATAPLAFCIADAPVAAALEQITAGRSIGPHALVVQRVAIGAPLPTCHVLYTSHLDPQQVADVVAATRGVSVLSVSDAERFTAHGGVAQFFVENARLRFSINVDAAARARLRLSSNLLGLATIVRDDRKDGRHAGQD